MIDKSDDKRTFKVVDLDSDLNASVARLEQLRAGRPHGSIPLNDDYWKALKKHQAAHNPKQ